MASDLIKREIDSLVVLSRGENHRSKELDVKLDELYDRLATALLQEIETMRLKFNS